MGLENVLCGIRVSWEWPCAISGCKVDVLRAARLIAQQIVEQPWKMHPWPEWLHVKKRRMRRGILALDRLWMHKIGEKGSEKL